VSENKGGRPLKFKTPEELQTKIEDYFDTRTRQARRYTVAGLCRWLKCGRDLLIDYNKKDQFSDTIKDAKLRIEEQLEEILISGQPCTGIIFNLKNNFGWKDRQEIESSGSIKIGSITKEDAETVKSVFDSIRQ
jgi:hypothetical protein